MREAVLFVLFGGVYALQIQQSELIETKDTVEAVCPAQEQVFIAQTSSEIQCAYMCASSETMCKGASYASHNGQCYGCRNTPAMSPGTFGTQAETKLYAIKDDDCKDPPLVSGATLLPGETISGSVRRYTCDVNHTNHRPDTGMTIKCQANNIWSPAKFQFLPGLPLSFIQVGAQILKIGQWRTRKQAYSDCLRYGSLIKIDTYDKQETVRDYLNSIAYDQNIWIQGKRNPPGDNAWTYDNGSAIPVDRLFWADEKSDASINKMCIGLKAKFNFSWIAISCAGARSYICEYFEKD